MGRLAADTEEGQSFLVDLGWLPVQGDRQLPKPARLAGTLDVEGLLLPPPSPLLPLRCVST